MADIQINIQEPSLSLITSGQKTIEVRLNKNKFKDLQIGDTMTIENSGILLMVEGKNSYDSFRDLLVAEGLEKVAPHRNSVEEAEMACYQIYTKEQEREFGVLAIKIKVA